MSTRSQSTYPLPMSALKKASEMLLNEELDVLKLSLSIFKQKELNDYLGKNRIRFAVVDLDRSNEYPVNFVCILPKQIKENGGYHTKFESKFGDESLDLAKRLLKHSLRAENDWEVKQEIIERLKLLKQKPKKRNKKPLIFQVTTTFQRTE